MVLSKARTLPEAARRRNTTWKPFLHHISKGGLQPRRTISLRAPRKLPRVLTVVEVQTILDACDRLRDRFLFTLLYEGCHRHTAETGRVRPDLHVTLGVLGEVPPELPKSSVRRRRRFISVANALARFRRTRSGMMGPAYMVPA
ncbi:hypothetical protein [Streptosporangium sp. NPDC001681]|uniref:hypothetical protein n=1 Tax=Streptosporangium sp. NPDC001681 TaxID=3154395 RepID=UPI0033205D68